MTNIYIYIENTCGISEEIILMPKREIRWFFARHVNFKNPVCLHMVLGPSLEFFTDMETLSLTVNGFIF